MLTTRQGGFPFLRAGVLAVLLVSLLPIAGYAQRPQQQQGTKADEITTTEILTEGLRLYDQGRYPEAIQRFQDFLAQAGTGTTLDRAVTINQDVRYKLAILLIDQERKIEAITYLEEYVNERFATHMREAYKMLVVCYFETEQFEKCIEAIDKAIDYNENPIIEAGPQFTSLDDAEGVFTDDEEMEEPDEPYTQQELSILHFFKAESFYNLRKFAECIDPFTYVIDHTTDQLQKGYCMMQMINALLEQDLFDRIIAWVPQLYRTPARYDIRVNLALMNAAESLFAEGEYDSALPLYRMIVPKDELIAYQREHLMEMRLEAGLPPNMGEELTPEEEILFAQPEEDPLMSRPMSGGSTVQVTNASNDDEPEVPREIRELENLLETLENVAPYENFVNLQMAELYKEVNRYWEAVRFYDSVYEATPDTEVGERALYESVNVLIEMLQAGPEAEQRVLAYLETHQTGLYPRLVSYLLTTYYQSNEEWRKVLDLRPHLESFDMGNAQWMQYDSQLGFMQGVAELMLANYSNAVDHFEYIMETYPGTEQEPSSLFWCGFSYLCLEKNQKAYECFDRYTRDFPGGRLLDEAYYQGGIALFGMDDKLDEASKRFTYVIESFGSNSVVFADACNMRADIRGSKGELDAAVEDYRAAFEAAQRVAQATYATFGMCEIFKVDTTVRDSDDIREAVNLYLAEWADQGADIAKAMLWLGRVGIQDGDFLGAVERYYEAVTEYGGQLQQDGVDQIIPELVKLATTYLSAEDLERYKNRLQVHLDSSETSPTLKLRLRVILAKFNGTEDELGMELMTELEDLTYAPPPVLEAICLASLEAEDYSRAEEVLESFQKNFDESVYIRSAYKLRAIGQHAEGDYEGALETIAAAQEDFGTTSEVAWAQLLKATVLLDQARKFKTDAELTQEDLVAAADTQLNKAQSKLATVTEQLAAVKPDDKDAEVVKRQLQDAIDELEARISGLQPAVQGNLRVGDLRDLLAQNGLEDARTENMNVFGEPGWRGEPYAQATYQMGQVEEEAGLLLKAHSYYQRVYFQYRGVGSGRWGAKGYLAAAKCLENLASEADLSATERRQYRDAAKRTLQAFVLDEYANNDGTQDLISEAKDMLGSSEVETIQAIIDSGIETNIVVNVEAEMDVSGTTDEGSGDGSVDDSDGSGETQGGEA